MKKRTAALGLGLPLLGAGIFSAELYKYVFCREGSRLLSPLLDKKTHAPEYYAFRDSSASLLRQRPQTRFTLRSDRGEKLCGFYFPAGGSGKRIVFLIHGYRSEHAETAGMYFDYYASRGFDIFCCDHTAHGESGGRLIGFDRFECEDCLKWLDFLQDQFGRDIQVVLHGFSMGAATVMRMSDRCPACVRLLVEDSGYCSAQEQLRGQLGAAYPLMRLMHRVIAGYDLRDCDVRPSLSRCSLPVLFVHGRDDGTVPFDNAPRLYALYEGEKDCLYTEKARHVESMFAAPEAYAEKLDGMLRRYLGTAAV